MYTIAAATAIPYRPEVYIIPPKSHLDIVWLQIEYPPFVIVFIVTIDRGATS